MALTTTWTAQDAVAFTAGTLGTIADCQTQVENNINRGTLSATTTPSTTEVQNWLIRGKQELQDSYGFSWRRAFKYADTVAGTYRYALPVDFGGGGTVLRDLTQNKRLDFMDATTFDTAYPDVAGSSNSTPVYYTIKDRELWIQTPADAVYRLELEYQRTGDDSTATDISYLPELMRFRVCDYATSKAFMRLQEWNAAGAYKSEWEYGKAQSKRGDGKKKWAAMNYMARNWHNVK